MPVPKQTIDIPFTGTLDESTAKMLLEPGQFATFTNCRTDGRGSIQARPCFVKTGATGEGDRLVSFNGSLYGISYNPLTQALAASGSPAWYSIGYLPSATNERIARVRLSQKSVSDCDMVANDVATLIAYRNPDTGAITLLVTENASGRTILDHYAVPSASGGCVRCVPGNSALGEVLIAWRSAGTIKSLRVTMVAAGVTIGGISTPITDGENWASVSQAAFDIAYSEPADNWMIIYKRTTDTFVYVREVTSGGSVVRSYNTGYTTTYPHLLGVAVDALGKVFALTPSGSSLKGIALTSTLGLTVAVTLAPSIGSQSSAAGIVYLGDETAGYVVSEQGDIGGPLANELVTFSWGTFDVYGDTASGGTATGYAVSKPFCRENNGGCLVYVNRGNTYHLVDLRIADTNPGGNKLKPVTNAAYQVAAGGAYDAAVTDWKLQAVNPTTGGAVSALPVFFLVRSSSVSDPTVLDKDQVRGFDELRITYGSSETGQTATLDGVLYISGGLLCEFDGRWVYENGFVDEPRAKWMAGAGMALESGRSHGAIEVWDWWDSKGRRHQSHPSLPVLKVPAPVAIGALTYSGGGTPPTVTVVENVPTIDMNLKIVCSKAGATGAGEIRWSFDNGGTYSDPIVAEESVDLKEYRTGAKYSAGEYVGVRLSFATTGTMTLASQWTANNTGSLSLSSIRVDYCQMTLRDPAHGKILCSPYVTGPNGRVYYRAFAFEQYATTFADPIVNVIDGATARNADIQTYPVDAPTYLQILYSQPDGSGELPNDPIHGGCTHLAVHGDRLFAASAEFPTRLRYSKPSVPGLPISFPEGFEIDIGERITGIVSLGTTLVVFSREAVFVVQGDGPDATGGGGAFSAPYRLPSEHGCTDSRSIARFEGGVLFRSVRGIMLLDRGLNVSYVGAPVERSLESGTEILAAVVVPKQEQVRFLTTDNAAQWLVFDYSEQPIVRWYVWSHKTAIPTAACVLSDVPMFLDSLGNVWVEDSTTSSDNADASLWMGPTIETGWIHLGKLANFKRLWRVAVSFESYGSHGLRLSYLTSENKNEFFDWTAADLDAYPEKIRQVVLHLNYQQARAWKFVINAFPPATGVPNYPTFTLHGLSLQIGLKEQVRRSSP